MSSKEKPSFSLVITDFGKVEVFDPPQGDKIHHHCKHHQCAQFNANITEVTQTVLQDLFCMIMLIDISAINCELTQLVSTMAELGERSGLSIHVMHEDIFNSMHRIQG